MITVVSRFVEVDENRDYVIPAVKLVKPVSQYYVPAIHIGLSTDRIATVCFCGQHFKQESSNWDAPSVEKFPDITCKGCLRTMRKIIRKNPGTPYKAIIGALHQKTNNIEYHVRKEATTPSVTYEKSEPEAYPR